MLECAVLALFLLADKYSVQLFCGLWVVLGVQYVVFVLWSCGSVAAGGWLESCFKHG